MGEKIENFTASFAESIAQQRGRNTEWAIQAVRKSVSITEKEALKIKVIDVVARTSTICSSSPWPQIGIEGASMSCHLRARAFERYGMSLKQKVLNTNADPNIAYLLMMAGILASTWSFPIPVIFPRGRSDLSVAGFRVLQLLADQLCRARVDHSRHRAADRRSVRAQLRVLGVAGYFSSFGIFFSLRH